MIFTHSRDWGTVGPVGVLFILSVDRPEVCSLRKVSRSSFLPLISRQVLLNSEIKEGIAFVLK